MTDPAADDIETGDAERAPSRRGRRGTRESGRSATPRERPPRERPPLDPPALERLALAYVERFATSRARLASYLARKLAQRGWAGEAAADPDAIADRLATLGYVDDGLVAEARGRSLARRGYGARRLGQELHAYGIAGEDAAEALREAEESAWITALRFAKRKRIGPFAASPPDEAGKRRAFAAMLRAGHGIDHARKIIAAPPESLSEADE
jgi:regulatory protein